MLLLVLGLKSRGPPTPPFFFNLMTVSGGAYYVSGPPLCLSGIVTFAIQTTCHSLVQGDFLIRLCVLIFDHLCSNFWQPMSIGGLGLGHVSLTWFPSLLASLLLLFPWAGVSSLLKHKSALCGFQFWRGTGGLDSSKAMFPRVKTSIQLQITCAFLCIQLWNILPTFGFSFSQTALAFSFLFILNISFGIELGYRHRIASLIWHFSVQLTLEQELPSWH